MAVINIVYRVQIVCVVDLVVAFDKLVYQVLFILLFLLFDLFLLLDLVVEPFDYLVLYHIGIDRFFIDSFLFTSQIVDLV